MRFDLKTPCSECPFLRGSATNTSLAEGRIKGIVEDLRSGCTFTCHKTLDKPSADQQHCGGALQFLERENNPNQMMRIAERIGIYNRHQLVEHPNLIEGEEV